ncbi:MAG TPA: alpha/beta hydrolase [Woeseiaceae bacterium]|nr:alpha/beta hydrolase [Woeseiaceae bacterium]
MTTDFDEKYYKAGDGLRLYYRDYGAGKHGDQTAVICLHGLTRNSRDFERLAAELSSDYRVICPDFRGRGESEYDSNWRNYHPAQYAEDILTLVLERGLAHVRLVGTSLGGMVAALLASAAGERVAAVVLNDIGPEIHAVGLGRIVASAGNLPRAENFAVALANTRANYELALPDWSAENWRWYTQNTYRQTASGDFELNYDRNIGTAVRAGLAGLQGSPQDIFDALADIPTLLIRGAISDVMTADIAARMQQRKPDLDVVSVPNRGHVPILDEKEALDAIRTFLKET